MDSFSQHAKTDTSISHSNRLSPQPKSSHPPLPVFMQICALVQRRVCWKPPRSRASVIFHFQLAAQLKKRTQHKGGSYARDVFSYINTRVRSASSRYSCRAFIVVPPRVYIGEGCARETKSTCALFVRWWHRKKHQPHYLL
jgi:hypothetical protein